VTSPHAAAADDHSTWIAVLMAKARTSLNANNVLEAAACYEEILKFDPKHSEALVKKGSALERLNRFEAAIESYDRAIEVDGKHTLAYLRKAAACNRLGRYQDAVECFEQALQVEEKAAQTAGRA
jgi:tetratricopeptide (TPR) repeat protein